VVKVAGNEATLKALAPVGADVASSVRAEKWETAVDAALAEGVFAVAEIELAPKEEKAKE
jgi:hypothetical protein